MKGTIILGIILVLSIACIGTGAANLVVNGDFEAPDTEGKIITTLAGNELPGWTIDAGGDIQLISSAYWQTAGGVQSIDMAGTTPANIRQTLNTIPGENYELTFWIAGNPDGNAKNMGYEQKELVIAWDGAELSPAHPFDTTGKTRNDMGWTKVTVPNLRATSPTTELVFITALPSGPYGIALDEVSVERIDPEIFPAPEFPGTGMPAVLIAGLFVIVLLVRKTGKE